MILWLWSDSKLKQMCLLHGNDVIKQNFGSEDSYLDGQRLMPKCVMVSCQRIVLSNDWPNNVVSASDRVFGSHQQVSLKSRTRQSSTRSNPKRCTYYPTTPINIQATKTRPRPRDPFF
jgi:hypothetical protein